MFCEWQVPVTQIIFDPEGVPLNGPLRAVDRTAGRLPEVPWFLQGFRRRLAEGFRILDSEAAGVGKAPARGDLADARLRPGREQLFAGFAQPRGPQHLDRRRVEVGPEPQLQRPWAHAGAGGD